jgi:sialic acid synthase
MEKPIVIAEIGCNHMGDLEIAKKMIRVAASFCEVDIVKFQKRSPKELLSAEQYNSPHPNPAHSFGTTYGEHREYLEFSADQHRQLKETAESENVVYSTSVWDIRSAKEIVKLDPALLKIPSACNLDFDMLSYLCDDYGREIHVSLGMTNRAEEDKIVDFFVKKNRNRDVVLYACTSGYPVPFEDLALLEISRLKEKFGERVRSIGFSGHHNGIAMDVAAATLGASHVERHFTLNRTWKGTDHAASLEPDGLRRLARDLRNLTLALTYKEKEILDIERAQRDKLKKLK